MKAQDLKGVLLFSAPTKPDLKITKSLIVIPGGLLQYILVSH